MPADFAFAEPNPRQSRRGFSNIVIILLMGVMSVTALLVFQNLEEDSRLAAIERRAREARGTAEGGLMEIINDHRVLELLPDRAGSGARIQFGGPGQSAFREGAERSPKYSANITLVRTAPMLESSQRRVRAVLYEVRVAGQMPNGESADLEAIIYRTGVAPSNTAGAEVYGR